LKTVALVIGKSNIDLLDTELKELANHPSVQIEILTDEDFELMIGNTENESDNSIF